MKVFLLLVCLLCAVTDAYSQSNANPSDLRQAQDFISQLPAACRNSRYAVAADGTVVINILCDKNDRSAGMDGTIEIKNGIVKKIR